MGYLDKSFSGHEKVSLDEAGRLAIPRSMRAVIEDNVVFVTRGADFCLWLYTVEEWNKRLRKIRKTKPDSVHGRNIRRRYLKYAYRLEIDKQGRINIPQSLRELAGLSKDCVVNGQDSYIEIWDRERDKANECSEEEFRQISEEFALIEEDEFSDGNNAHSGTGGGNAALSGAEGRG